MARMLGDVAQPWYCRREARRGRHGRHSACRPGRSPRQQKRREGRAWRREAEGLVRVVDVEPVGVPYPVSAEHPPADFDG